MGPSGCCRVSFCLDRRLFIDTYCPGLGVEAGVCQLKGSFNFGRHGCASSAKRQIICEKMEDEKLLTVNRVKNYVPSIFRDKDANRLPRTKV
jgi:hypothetical protein